MRSLARQRAKEPPSDDTVEFMRVLERDPCSYCGGPMHNIDHIVASSRGGDNQWWNLTAACERCNKEKFTAPLLHYLLRRGEPRKHVATGF